MSEVTFGGNTVGEKALWLNGVARGEQNERERIAEAFREEQRTAQLEKRPFSGSVRFARALALIAGEQKPGIVDTETVESLTPAENKVSDLDELQDRIAKLESVCDFLYKKLVEPYGPDIILTDRQQMVAELAARGYMNLDIANKLHVSQGTVKSDISKIMRKLGVSKRSEIFLQSVRWSR